MTIVCSVSLVIRHGPPLRPVRGGAVSDLVPPTFPEGTFPTQVWFVPYESRYHQTTKKTL